jgi:hypothetical protein
MTIKVDKWVVAGVHGVRWSDLTDMDDVEEVARLCDFFGFDVAHLWIDANPEGYLQGLEEGFEATSMLEGEEIAHALNHTSEIIKEHGKELIIVARKDQIDRILAEISEQMIGSPYNTMAM